MYADAYERAAFLRPPVYEGEGKILAVVTRFCYDGSVNMLQAILPRHDEAIARNIRRGARYSDVSASEEAPRYGIRHGCAAMVARSSFKSGRGR